MYIGYIFLYGFLAHGSLATSILLTNEYINKFKPGFLTYFLFLYLCGHATVSLANFIRIKNKYRKLLITPITGNIGHGLLFIFFSCLGLNLIKTNELYDINNLIGALGQLGMISVFWTDYIYQDKVNVPKLVNKTHILTFILLFYFYTYLAYNQKNTGPKFRIYFYGLCMVSIFYALLFVNQIINYKKFIKDV